MRSELICCAALILIVFLNASTGRCAASLTYECYVSNSFPLKGTGGQTVFDASKKIYVYVKFSNLPPGSYLVNTTWLKYSGEAERRNTSEIRIDSETDYTYYSWFKLLRKGPFSKMLMGEEYDSDQKGARTVIVDVNGERICAESFEVI
jgi:hypothetical protein